MKKGVRITGLILARVRLRRFLLALLVLQWGAAGALAAPDSLIPPPARPTRVATSFFFSTIDGVDSVNETFNADFYLLLAWDDPRLASLQSGEIDTARIWEPKVEGINSRDLQRIWDYFEFPEPGKVQLQNRFSGTFAAPMDLHDFPFDRQVLPVLIESSTVPVEGMVFAYPGVQNREKAWSLLVKPADVLGHGVRMPEWTVDAIRVREMENYYDFLKVGYSRYGIEIYVTRRAGFYIWKVIVMEVLLVILSWVVFLQEPGDIGNRSTVSVTLLLATVAFSYVISGITPRISYLTLLDYFLLGSFFAIFLSALENVVVYLLHKRGSADRSSLTTRIDRWSLVLFPVAFLVFNALLWARVLLSRVS
ncbi:MAG TPA: hypothetical protein VF756_22520 [Thermoanaerobaculia bacterium]